MEVVRQIKEDSASLIISDSYSNSMNKQREIEIRVVKFNQINYTIQANKL